MAAPNSGEPEQAASSADALEQEAELGGIAAGAAAGALLGASVAGMMGGALGAALGGTVGSVMASEGVGASHVGEVKVVHDPKEAEKNGGLPPGVQEVNGRRAGG